MTVVAALVSRSRPCVPKQIIFVRTESYFRKDGPRETRNQMLTRRWRSAYVVELAQQSEFHALRSPASDLHLIPRTARPRSEVDAAPFPRRYLGAIQKDLAFRRTSLAVEAQLRPVVLCNTLDRACERWQMRNSNASQGEWK